jgi:hypothetical protein
MSFMAFLAPGNHGPFVGLARQKRSYGEAVDVPIGAYMLTALFNWLAAACCWVKPADDACKAFAGPPKWPWAACW